MHGTGKTGAHRHRFGFACFLSLSEQDTLNRPARPDPARSLLGCDVYAYDFCGWATRGFVVTGSHTHVPHSFIVSTRVLAGNVCVFCRNEPHYFLCLVVLAGHGYLIPSDFRIGCVIPHNIALGPYGSRRRLQQGCTARAYEQGDHEQGPQVFC